ncbi:hypothetical protein [Dactylosporangium salmoneum]|uniref:Tetratricopeptide repeat protein n=1 Tax=Dactylosporangium salmoneum TaxID=53361 RepID=A0ABN3G106_9ACTN
MRTGHPTRTGHHRGDPDVDGPGSGQHATPQTPFQLVDRAGVLLSAYDFGGAYQLLIELRSRIEQGVPVEPVDAADATRMLAETLLALGQPDAAGDLLAEFATWPGLGPYQAAMLTLAQARLLTAQDRLDDAAACYRDIIERGTGGHEAIHWPVLLATAGAAALTATQGRPATAEPALHLAYTRLADEYGGGHVDTVRVGLDLVRVRMQLGGTSAARRLAAQLLPAAVTGLGEHHPLVDRLTVLVDDLTAPPRDRGGAPAAEPGRRDALRSAAAREPALGRRRPAGRRRWLPHWAIVAVVLCLAAVSAAAVIMLAIPTSTPARTLGVAPRPITGQASTGDSWTSSYRPAGDVRIVRATGTTIDVAWTDPTNGTRPTILFLAKDDTPAFAAATVQAATTSYRLTGLDRRAHRYCIGVAVAYSPTTVARAPDVCTSRPATHRSGAPGPPSPKDPAS